MKNLKTILILIAGTVIFSGCNLVIKPVDNINLHQNLNQINLNKPANIIQPQNIKPVADLGKTITLEDNNKTMKFHVGDRFTFQEVQPFYNCMSSTSDKKIVRETIVSLLSVVYEAESPGSAEFSADCKPYCGNLDVGLGLSPPVTSPTCPKVPIQLKVNILVE